MKYCFRNYRDTRYRQVCRASCRGPRTALTKTDLDFWKTHSFRSSQIWDNPGPLGLPLQHPWTIGIVIWNVFNFLLLYSKRISRLACGGTLGAFSENLPAFEAEGAGWWSEGSLPIRDKTQPTSDQNYQGTAWKPRKVSVPLIRVPHRTETSLHSNKSLLVKVASALFVIRFLA